MDDIKAEGLMSRNVVSVNPGEPLSRVISLFHEKQISAIPVVVESNTLAGIITKADVIAHAYSWGSQVISDTEATTGDEPVEEVAEWSRALARDVMSPVLVTASVDATPIEIVEIMKKNEIHHVPITSEGKLVGIVSTFDLLKLIP